MGYWLARNYARGSKRRRAAFDASALPGDRPIPRRPSSSFAAGGGLRERDEKLSALLADKSALGRGVKRLRARGGRGEEGERGRAGHARLLEAGPATSSSTLAQGGRWLLDQPRDREVRSRACPTGRQGIRGLRALGDDGKPLALVEAKRTKQSVQVGQQQAKLYAIVSSAVRAPAGHLLLERLRALAVGRRQLPPRAVQGFFKRAELELMIQRRASRKPLAMLRSTRPSSSGTTRRAPSAASAKPSSRTAIARPSW